MNQKVNQALAALVSAIQAEVRENIMAALGNLKAERATGDNSVTEDGDEPGEPRQRRTRRTRTSGKKLAALADAFLAFVKKNPQCKAEDIREGIGATTAQMPRLRALLEGKIKTKGEKRAMRYSVK